MKTKFHLTLFLLLNIGYLTAAEPQTLKSLHDLQWSERIIVVNLPENAEQSIEALQQERVKLEDRNVAWFVINERSITSNISSEYSTTLETDVLKRYPKDRIGVFLIGKDGGLKQQSSALDIEALTQMIDSMPMRQSEMRKTLE